MREIPEDILAAAEAVYGETGFLSPALHEAIVQAILAERDRDRWLPIETFFDHRTDFTAEVLIATRSYRGGVAQVAWKASVPYPAFVDMNGDSYFDATHWQPLPIPPNPHSLPTATDSPARVTPSPSLPGSQLQTGAP